MKKKNKSQKTHHSSRQRKTEKIATQYQRRLESPDNPKFKTPTSSAAGYLRCKIYRLASKPDANERGKRAKTKKRTRCRPDPRSIPLLLAEVFDQLGKTAKGDRNRLRLIAHELEYAAEHRVPPKFLIGFIHQNGGSKGIEKLRAAKARADESLSNSNQLSVVRTFGAMCVVD